jgi:hypothetical protein
MIKVEHLMSDTTIEIKGRRGRLREGSWENVPELAIITGENGAGKTQLLRAIAAGMQTSFPMPTPARRVPPPVDSAVKAVVLGRSIPPTSVVCATANWAVNASDATERHFHERVAQLYTLPERESKNRHVWENNPIYSDFSAVCGDEGAQGKSKPDIEEFRRRLTPVDIAMSPGQDGPLDVSMLFLAYALLRADLTFQGVSEVKIRERLGEPPWDVVDEILLAAGMPFKATIPGPPIPSVYAIEHRQYSLAFIDRQTGDLVPLHDLSSGEQVIISTLLWRFSAENRGGYFRLLLLDEPDAHLHPSMVRQFFNVIQKVFVEQRGVMVIMTTHSPSTVAIAPEGAIFILDRSDYGIPRLANRDAALRLLTANVPSLSVLYENRRQVFTESASDAKFYESVYRAANKYLVPEISLDFIPVGNEKDGGCDRVKAIVNAPELQHNPWIFGLIDKDVSNRKVGRVFVAGLRHSIENYVFDPLVLAIYLYHQRIVTRSFVGLSEGGTHLDVAHLPSDVLEAVCDRVASALFGAMEGSRQGALADAAEWDKARTLGESKVSVKYVCGLHLQRPAWLCEMKGHALENLARAAYPQLNKYKRTELLSHVLDIVFVDVPGLVPSDVCDSLRSIQTAAGSCILE